MELEIQVAIASIISLLVCCTPFLPVLCCVKTVEIFETDAIVSYIVPLCHPEENKPIQSNNTLKNSARILLVTANCGLFKTVELFVPELVRLGME